MSFKVYYFLIFNLLGVCQARELKFVQAIWRHGDRAPKKLPYLNTKQYVAKIDTKLLLAVLKQSLSFATILPNGRLRVNDQYDKKYWPRGWGELTDLGIQQLDELGNFLRNRYIGKFVSQNFDPSEVVIKASNANRAISSAEAVFKGMYHLNAGITNNGSWQSFPIPIQPPTSKNSDYLLKPTSVDCPGYKKASKSVTKSSKKDLANEFSDLYLFLGNVTGYGKKIKTKQVAKLVDIQREMIHNLPQPSWVYQKWPQYGGNTTIEVIAEIDRRTRMSEFANEKLQRLRGGYLLGDWLSRAKAVANGSQASPSKMMLYSSHEGTLLSLLFSLNLSDGEEIPYAAVIIMEIYKNDDGSFYAEIYYRKNGNLIPMTISGCSQSCPVDQLYELLEKNAYFSLNEVLKDCKTKRELSKEEDDDDNED